MIIHKYIQDSFTQSLNAQGISVGHGILVITMHESSSWVRLDGVCQASKWKNYINWKLKQHPFVTCCGTTVNLFCVTFQSLIMLIWSILIFFGWLNFVSFATRFSSTKELGTFLWKGFVVKPNVFKSFTIDEPYRAENKG